MLMFCCNGKQVFKITLEYWNFFVPDVYSSVSTLDANAPFAFGGPVAPSNRKALYAAVLSRLRLLMISRMAKPEEVRVQETLSPAVKSAQLSCSPRVPCTKDTAPRDSLMAGRRCTTTPCAVLMPCKKEAVYRSACV
jgi:CRM1 / Exportin repeat 2